MIKESIFQGSDMDADEDDYHDMDTTITPGYEDDFLFHMDDMFPAGNSTYPMGESKTCSTLSMSVCLCCMLIQTILIMLVLP